MNFKLQELTATHVVYIILTILILLYVYKMFYRKNKEQFDQSTSKKIEDIVTLLQKDFRDYLIGLNEMKYYDEKLGKYETYVYLRKVYYDKKLTKGELVSYFD